MSAAIVASEHSGAFVSSIVFRKFAASSLSWKLCLASAGSLRMTKRTTNRKAKLNRITTIASPISSICAFLDRERRVAEHVEILRLCQYRGSRLRLQIINAVLLDNVLLRALQFGQGAGELRHLDGCKILELFCFRRDALLRHLRVEDEAERDEDEEDEQEGHGFHHLHLPSFFHVSPLRISLLFNYN